ncbi:hypothetical protein EG329_007750 [Mollisiaceae sp. DMI_Dod_QoI]|nr:hypothetical protein EG329_007750 [Helotiales sp. DMI_Dod_QoI]
MSTNTTTHVGFWTDWSKGGVSGSTLTLSNRNGAVLIAALAIFIQLSGGRSWTILCFMAHQLRATKNAKDGLYHQQQAALRNSNSDVNAMWQFTKIGWAWRSRSVGGIQRSAILVLTALLHLLAFAATGLLASHITTVGSQVLLASSIYCGSWELQEGSTPSTAGVLLNASEMGHEAAYVSYQRLSMESSNKYVQNCLTNSQALPECDMFIRPQLNWTASNIPCPFNGLCLDSPAGSLHMDTGPLDSRDDLGINAQGEDRIVWRKNATCVPITTQGYTKSGNSSLSMSQEQQLEGIFNSDDLRLPFNYTAAFYGPTHDNYTFWGLSDPSLLNATYIYTNFRDIATIFHNDQVSPYQLHAAVADYHRGFEPIESLQSPNVTLTLIFASYYGTYIAPSEDLWLAAHRKIPTYQEESGGATGADIDQYSFDNPISVLACEEQLQFCNPARSTSDEGCSPSMSVNDMVMWIGGGMLETIFDTERQILTAEAIMMEPASRSTFYDVVKSLESPLLADALAAEGESLPPAPDQWILEASHWFSISLANMQRLLVDYATGPPSQFLRFVPQNQAEGDPTMAWLCSNQMIRRNDFINFSTLAISLIFGFGTIIILSSFWTEMIVGWMRSRRQRGEWRQRAWWSEETLQLQMKAFIGMGITGWKYDEIDRVPVNEADMKWSSVREWEEMRAQVGGRTDETKEDDMFRSMDSKKTNFLVNISPVSASSTEDLKRPNRSRSYSV